MNDLTTDHALQPLQATSFKGRPLTGIFIDEREWVWADVDAWAKALLMPAPLRPKLFASLGQRAAVLKEKRGEPFSMTDPKGAPWYRWAAINDALLAWHFRVAGRIQARDPRLTEDELFLSGNVDELRAWGDALQEKALRSAMTTGRAVAPVHGGNQQALAQAMALLAGVSQDHETRLTKVEAVVVRDSKQFISARAFCLERGIVADEHLPGMRIGLAQWLGNFLVKQGAPVGPKCELRMPNSSRTEMTNTYRRIDLEYALKKAPRQ